MSKQSRLVVLALVAVDLVMLAAALSAGFFIATYFSFWMAPDPAPVEVSIIFAVLALLLVTLLFALNRLYDLDVLFAGHREYAAVVRASSYGIAIVLIIAFLTEQAVSPGALALSWLLAILLVGGLRFHIRRLVFKLREAGHFTRRWLVVGSDEHAAAVAVQLNSPTSKGIRVVGFLDDYRPIGARVTDGLEVLGDPRAVREIARAHGVSTLVVVPHAISWESYRDLLELAAESDSIKIKLAPGLQHLVATGAQMTDSGFLPLVGLEPLRITGLDAVLKRVLDYAASAILLVAVGLLWALCSLAARLDRSGPVLLRRPVLGRRQARFNLLVFAAPVGSPSGDSPRRWAWRLRHAIAASRLGRLPSILNVIVGHMSLVGPRAINESDSAGMDEGWVRNLLLVRPGITGPAADAARGEGLEQQTVKDIAYVRNYSLWLDLRLLFASLKRVLRREKGLPSSYLTIHHPRTEVAPTTEAARRAS